MSSSDSFTLDRYFLNYKISLSNDKLIINVSNDSSYEYLKWIYKLENQLITIDENSPIKIKCDPKQIYVFLMDDINTKKKISINKNKILSLY